MKILNFAKSFTIIELLVAIFILSTGIVAILAMFPLGIRVVKSSEMATIGAQLGQEKMEEIISKSYDEISIGTTTEVSLPPPFVAYSRETRISYVDPANNLQETVSDLGIKEIKVKVSWKSPLRISSQEMEISTLIIKR